MKLSSSEINEIKNWYNRDNYTPIVSNKIIKKLKQFTVINNELIYANKIFLPSDKINEVLQENYTIRSER